MSLVLRIESKNNEIEQSVKILSSKLCKELEEFWGIKLKYEPIIFLLNSRKQINTIRQQDTDKKLVAWFWNKRFIFILRPDKFMKESVFSKKDFDIILKHELSHFFFFMITRGSMPAWMDEGLACYLAGQSSQAKINQTEIKKLIKSFYDFDRSIFPISTLTVEKLIKLNGKDNFVNFIKSFDKKINEARFKKIYKQFLKQEYSKDGIIKLLKQ